MIQIQADNFNELFVESYKAIAEFGLETRPRGLSCHELICPQLVLNKPKNCLITLSERKLNYAYSIIEKLMYVSGESMVDVICFYNKNMERFINKQTNQFDGAYGLRINQWGTNQLKWCYEKLKQDPDTRQAVITIHDVTDCQETLDPACTLSLQFILRENKLNLVCNMRSNDLLWGTCLDIPAFCFIQEIMAHWLGVEVGYYVHQPASLHYYDDKVDLILQAVNSQSLIKDEALPSWDVSFSSFDIALSKFWIEEKKIRLGLEPNMKSLKSSNALTDYLQRLKRFTDKKHEQKNTEGIV